MTGHGEARGHNERVSLTVEVRSVNNRHLKVAVRCPVAFLSLESRVEKLVRERVARGTVSVSINVRLIEERPAVEMNRLAIQEYWRQLSEIATALNVEPPTELTPLLSLPGIVEERTDRTVEESDWPLFESVLGEALDTLETFRREEGESMRSEMQDLANSIRENLTVIERHAPDVVVNYRERLTQRISDLLEGSQAEVDSNDLIREVSIFADRCDITEEVTRLRSHLNQYDTLIESEGSSGRKLDFLGQEMFRELNTIGSKANDVRISHLIVDMKACIEKMREIVQNIE
ncbi:hypothetical protein KOR42_31040 [Thalassoglobus neptunius]|uniref:YicC-like family, N-terminal region n=1 Tax=Thalassoglobus neptunius TaxID=1938619 RepID=A0A5C5WN25_9PLAN|nr:YicC/YloC family endoribonuclease [Thalassoglobus neptunius]TWT52236.1 hypothetical protein KOR42_31040 [Thalassoglobus neptunius]